MLGLALLAVPAQAAYTTSKSFTAVGGGVSYPVNPLNSPSISYSVTGTWVGTVVLQSSQNPTVYWNNVVSLTANGSGTTAVIPSNVISGSQPGIQPTNGAPLFFRFACTAYTSGTIVTSFTTTDALTRTAFFTQAKAGATAGWTVNAGADLFKSTLAASQTGSTLVLPIQGLRTGDTIVGYQVVGNATSSGNTATVDADLRYLTAAAANPTDASLGTTITTVTATANTLIVGTTGSSNTVTPAATAGGAVLATAHVIQPGETFYALVTGTTASSTTETVQGVQVIYVPGL